MNSTKLAMNKSDFKIEETTEYIYFENIAQPLGLHHVDGQINKLNHEGRIIYLEVNEIETRKGVGRQTVAIVEKLIKDLGGRKVIIYAEPEALSFWIKVGYKDTSRLSEGGFQILEKELN